MITSCATKFEVYVEWSSYLLSGRRKLGLGSVSGGFNWRATKLHPIIAPIDPSRSTQLLYEEDDGIGLSVQIPLLRCAVVYGTQINLPEFMQNIKVSLKYTVNQTWFAHVSTLNFVT